MVIVLAALLMFPCAAMAGTVPETAVLDTVEALLDRQEWRVVRQENGIQAWKFGNYSHELVFGMHQEQHMLHFSIVQGDQQTRRSFDLNRVTVEALCERGINPMVASALSRVTDTRDRDDDGRVPAFGGRFLCLPWISAGYNRTHDTADFLPEKDKGGLYLGTGVVYDPARRISASKMYLGLGDITLFDMNIVYDREQGEIMENYIFVNLLYVGVQRAAAVSSGRGHFRFVHGLFTNTEYFRPGYADSNLLWSHDLYRDQPHIQFITYSPVAWGGMLGWYGSGANPASVTFNWLASPSASINSALVMVNIPESEEDRRNSIFKAQNHKKQNFYYSTSVPLKAGFLIDHFYRLKFGVSYTWIFFNAFEDHVSWEELHWYTVQGGVYILDNLSLEARYERWNVKGRVDDRRDAHHWNRMVMELRYQF